MGVYQGCNEGELLQMNKYRFSPSKISGLTYPGVPIDVNVFNELESNTHATP